jgi:hypothetical protein
MATPLTRAALTGLQDALNGAKQAVDALLPNTALSPGRAAGVDQALRRVQSRHEDFLAAIDRENLLPLDGEEDSAIFEG